MTTLYARADPIRYKERERDHEEVTAYVRSGGAKYSSHPGVLDVFWP